MNFKNNLELSIYLRSFGIFDTNIISAIEETPIELFKVESANSYDGFKKNNNVFTLSFHGKKNYPFKKEKSDLDIEFPDKTNDEFYLNKLKEILPKVFDEFEPDFIFYLAGVDVLENDKLGRLSMTIEGCKQRDRFVLELCRKNNLPLQISMGGGYSVNIKDILEAHSNTYRLAQEIYF